MSNHEKNPKKGGNQPPIIKIHNLIKIYKSGEVETSALRGLNAEFYPGEISVIMGPSGCGKTTLLNVLGGIISYDAGDVFVDSVDIAKLTEKELDDYRLNKVGYI
ncbi:MAG: ATP-binding cassette domain-containing protein, partial [Promethearchaeota archaeon]